MPARDKKCTIWTADARAAQENDTLRVATKTVAEDLVRSLKEAYEEYGSAPPERYMREIESQTTNNPTLAQ